MKSKITKDFETKTQLGLRNGGKMCYADGGEIGDDPMPLTSLSKSAPSRGRGVRQPMSTTPAPAPTPAPEPTAPSPKVVNTGNAFSRHATRIDDVIEGRAAGGQIGDDPMPLTPLSSNAPARGLRRPAPVATPAPAPAPTPAPTVTPGSLPSVDTGNAFSRHATRIDRAIEGRANGGSMYEHDWSGLSQSIGDDPMPLQGVRQSAVQPIPPSPLLSPQRSAMSAPQPMARPDISPSHLHALSGVDPALLGGPPTPFRMAAFTTGIRGANGGLVRMANGGILNDNWDNEQYEYDHAGENFANGGVHQGVGAVEGPGGPREDKVPAMLSNDEYVLPAKTVEAFGGKDVLDHVVKQTNDGREPGPTPVRGLRQGLENGGYPQYDEFGNPVNRPAAASPTAGSASETGYGGSQATQAGSRMEQATQTARSAAGRATEAARGVLGRVGNAVSNAATAVKATPGRALGSVAKVGTPLALGTAAYQTATTPTDQMPGHQFVEPGVRDIPMNTSVDEYGRPIGDGAPVTLQQTENDRQLGQDLLTRTAAAGRNVANNVTFGLANAFSSPAAAAPTSAGIPSDPQAAPVAQEPTDPFAQQAAGDRLADRSVDAVTRGVRGTALPTQANADMLSQAQAFRGSPIRAGIDAKGNMEFSGQGPSNRVYTDVDGNTTTDYNKSAQYAEGVAQANKDSQQLDGAIQAHLAGGDLDKAAALAVTPAQKAAVNAAYSARQGGGAQGGADGLRAEAAKYGDRSPRRLELLAKAAELDQQQQGLRMTADEHAIQRRGQDLVDSHARATNLLESLKFQDQQKMAKATQKLNNDKFANEQDVESHNQATKQVEGMFTTTGKNGEAIPDKAEVAKYSNYLNDLHPDLAGMKSGERAKVISDAKVGYDINEAANKAGGVFGTKTSLNQNPIVGVRKSKVGDVMNGTGPASLVKGALPFANDNVVEFKDGSVRRVADIAVDKDGHYDRDRLNYISKALGKKPEELINEHYIR